VVRISRFRHGEGSAEGGDKSYQHGGCRPLRALFYPDFSRADKESGAEFQRGIKGNRACPFLMRCERSWRSI
jgi:hypothetical protein